VTPYWVRLAMRFTGNSINVLCSLLGARVDCLVVAPQTCAEAGDNSENLMWQVVYLRCPEPAAVWFRSLDRENDYKSAPSRE